MELRLQFINESDFNENAWREVCNAVALDATRRCEYSSSRYKTLYRCLIDQAVGCLPKTHHSKAILIARDWDDLFESENHS